MSHGRYERSVFENAEWLDGMLRLLVRAKERMGGTLPIPAAEACFEGVEDAIASIETKIRAALEIFDAEIEHIELDAWYKEEML